MTGPVSMTITLDDGPGSRLPGDLLRAGAEVRLTVEDPCRAEPATPLAVASLSPPAEQFNRVSQAVVGHRVNQLVRLLAYSHVPSVGGRPVNQVRSTPPPGQSRTPTSCVSLVIPASRSPKINSCFRRSRCCGRFLVRETCPPTPTRTPRRPWGTPSRQRRPRCLGWGRMRAVAIPAAAESWRCSQGH